MPAPIHAPPRTQLQECLLRFPAKFPGWFREALATGAPGRTEWSPSSVPTHPHVAVDVGAAPGGWTRLLARACAPVYAIDPANLDPDVVALPNVVHIKGLVGKRGCMGVGCKECMCVRGRTTTFALGK